MNNEQCPNCGSFATNYDAAFGFHKCEDCSEIWAHDKDDPDYEDCESSYEDDFPNEKSYSDDPNYDPFA